MIVLRSVAFNVVFFGGTFVLTILGTLTSLVAPRRLMWCAVAWARMTLWAARVLCGIHLEVTGREHLPPGAALIASRHQSALDTMVWFILVPRCCYVVKKELLRIPLMGRLITLTDMIVVDRDGGGRSIRTLVKGGIRAAKAGRQIVIFPEGTRAEPGHALALQPGVAALASRTGLAVVPVITDSGRLWGRRAFHKNPGTVHIVIRPPLPTGLPREALMQLLRQELDAGIDIPAPH